MKLPREGDFQTHVTIPHSQCVAQIVTWQVPAGGGCPHPQRYNCLLSPKKGTYLLFALPLPLQHSLLTVCLDCCKYLSNMMTKIKLILRGLLLSWLGQWQSNLEIPQHWESSTRPHKHLSCLKDLTTPVSAQKQHNYPALADRNICKMNENIPKSWKLKVKNELEKIAQNRCGHPCVNQVCGTYSRKHPSQKST